MKPKLNLPGLAFVALVASQVLLDSPCLRAASVDPNDTREPCLGCKDVEFAFEIRHAADGSRCVHPIAVDG